MRIVGQRLSNQRITRPIPAGPAQVVGWFGAVQAQVYGPAKWALALRMSRRTTDAAIDRAVDQGRILRTHVLRPTWHFVLPADIRWMQALTAPHVHRALRNYDRQIGLSPAMLVRAASLIERVLGDGPCLTRREIGAHLKRAKLPDATSPLAHFAMYAELEGLICSGPRRGKQNTYALVEQRAPRGKQLPRDEALAELAKRFLRSHAPATIRDFVWWSGLSTVDAKRAFEMNRAKPVDIDGIRYWSLAGNRGRSGGGVRLLPIFDEYLVAYRDRVAVPHPAYSLENVSHSLMIDGQLAGMWRAAPKRGGVTVDLALLRRLTRSEEQGVAAAARKYGAFLGVPVSVHTREDARRTLRD